MIDKKGFTTQEFVIAGLLFTSVIIFFTIGIADIQGNYPNSPNIVSEDFESNYNQLSQQTEDINTMRETSLSGEGLSFRGAFDVTFGSFFTIMQLVFGSLVQFGQVFTFLAIDFPFIDSIVIEALMTLGLAIITVILIFRLINAVGRNPV